MKVKKKHIAMAAVPAFYFVCYALHSDLVVKNHTVKTKKISPGQKIRIVIISDLHSHVFKNEQAELIDMIDAQSPDIIALVGDIADDDMPVRGAKLFAEKLQDLKTPTYYVTGNHEFRRHDINNIKNVFGQYGVQVLEHTYQSIEINGQKLVIAGVDDPAVVKVKPDFDWRGKMQESFCQLAQEPCFKVLLCHQPHRLETFASLPFDLLLSGHTHGGQVRLPGINRGLFASGQGWFPKFSGGLYDHGSYQQVISRGVSIQPLIPRVFNPPEVTVVDIIGQR